MISVKRRLFIFCVLFSAVALLFGCLGGSSGGGGGGTTPIGPTGNAELSGRAYFADRQLYNGIPIFARDPTGVVTAATRTTSGGEYVFSGIPAGTYDLLAVTGDAEVLFGRGIRVDTAASKRLTEVSLLCLQNVVVDRITSSSFRIAFQSNIPATSRITFGTNPEKFPVSTGLTKTHQAELPGLSSNTNYPVTIYLDDSTGQAFTHSGINVVTSPAVGGPLRTSVAIENGAYETRIPQVTVYLKGTNVTQMRLGFVSDLSDASWETFTETKAMTLLGSDGTKRVYAQFRDSSLTTTSIINDNILLNTSSQGYLGIWIEGGKTQTSNSTVWLTLLYPGATQVMLSSKTDFSTSFWETYVQSRRWLLSTGDGTKSVFAKFSGPGVDSTQVFTSSIEYVTPTGTGVATGTSTSTSTATGTTPTPTPSPIPPNPDDVGPFELVIGLDGVPQIGHPEQIATEVNVLLEGDSKTFYAEFRNKNTGKVLEKYFHWYVLGIEGGNDTWGKMDSSLAVYTSPNQLPSGGDSLPIVAKTFNSYLDEGTGKTQQFSATITVHLTSFWVERSTGMKKVDGDRMSIYSLLVDPIWREGEDYYLFAGTNGNGLWWSVVDSNVDAAPIQWKSSALATQELANPPEYVVNKIAVNSHNHDVAIATEEGVYILGGGSRAYDSAMKKIASGSAKSVIWDLTDPTYLYVCRSTGLDRIELSSDSLSVNRIVQTSGEYRTLETRFTTGSPTREITAYSYATQSLFSNPLNALGWSPSSPNTLFLGTTHGSIGVLENARNFGGPLTTLESQPRFITASGTEVVYGPVTVLAGGTGFSANFSFINGSGGPFPIVTEISIDPNSPWTLLVGSSQGVYRSVDRGGVFSKEAVAGDNVNCRGVLIDPTNVINFYAVAEDGLYRTKSKSWEEIKTGLNGQKTMNCFTQSAGAPGANRRIWVGTTGGVYAGAKSLDLY
ncbi:MAG: hypothetical protein WA705_27020 [Candidatus Ozemobacteraceae bacterium]